MSMQEAAKFAQSLSDETRWRVVALLWDQPLCVCELADILQMPQSSVSSHIQVLRRAGLLESERREKWVYYRVTRGFLALLATLRRHFGLYPASQLVLAGDEKRMRKRLAERASSCCPPPKELTFKTPRTNPRAHRAA